MERVFMNTNKIKILKNTTEEDFGYPNFTKEDMQKLRYREDSPKNERELTKIEWKIKCFTHRVKRRIENLIYYFSGSMEE